MSATEERIIYAEVHSELRRATGKFGNFHNAHEGYAVLLEEVDELWEAIKHGTRKQQRKEAVQVAAMAVRLLRDCYEGEVSGDATQV